MPELRDPVPCREWQISALLGCWDVGLWGCWIVGLLGCWAVGRLFVGLFIVALLDRSLVAKIIGPRTLADPRIQLVVRPAGALKTAQDIIKTPPSNEPGAAVPRCILDTSVSARVLAPYSASQRLSTGRVHNATRLFLPTPLPLL